MFLKTVLNTPVTMTMTSEAENSRTWLIIRSRVNFLSHSLRRSQCQQMMTL